MVTTKALEQTGRRRPSGSSGYRQRGSKCLWQHARCPCRYERAHDATFRKRRCLDPAASGPAPDDCVRCQQ